MPSTCRMLELLGRTALLLGSMALLLAWAVPLDPTQVPQGTPALEIAALRVDTLRFQLGLLLAAAAAGLLLLRSWRFALAGVLLAAWALLPAMHWPTAERAPRAGAPVLRVLSLNLGGDLAIKEKVLEAIHAAQADVIVLQEYTPAWRNALSRLLIGSFPFNREIAREDNFGMALFSRLQWAGLQRIELASSGTPQLRVEFALVPTPLVLYAVHLMPPVTARYAQHRAEFADLLQRIDAEQLPTAVLGDFNFVDHGAMAQSLHQRGFYDAHGLAGSGRGATWPVHAWLHYVPGLRIDHVYLGPGLTSTAAWVGAPTGSDHLPIGATITFEAP